MQIRMWMRMAWDQGYGSMLIVSPKLKLCRRAIEAQEEDNACDADG